MTYARVVLGYHGCDAAVAARVFGGESFRASENDHDWLGTGIYFWEHGVDRALAFAHAQQRRGRLRDPAVVGALLQLGDCFDLLDTRATRALAEYSAALLAERAQRGLSVPRNTGSTEERKRRMLDCWLINRYLTHLDATGRRYDTVRCAFREGASVVPGSAIYLESHIQIAVRNSACIIGVFHPMVRP